MADSKDKRNYPRAKVLSMTVRYKSATVDDFVEHHSDNVSRGGIFIKTSSPFPPGTLLKFEIRLADDEAVLSGVGRVVWKRDEPGEAADEPAGMGVKFIKLDEKSRALISRLVDAQEEGASKYDKGFAQGGTAEAATSGKKETALGLGGIGSGDDKTSKDAKSSAKDAGDAKSDAKSEGMFPKTDPEKDMPPPEERTVMKQAAELLEQALAGAGGSMDDVGSSDDSASKGEASPKGDSKTMADDDKKDEPEDSDDNNKDEDGADDDKKRQRSHSMPNARICS